MFWAQLLLVQLININLTLDGESQIEGFEGKYWDIKKQSCSKSSLISTSNKKTNESTAFEHLCKTAESLDLEKMVDYIVSSTKVYNRYNDNKENYCNNFNNLINQNDTNDIIYSNNSEKKSIKKNKKIRI